MHLVLFGITFVLWLVLSFFVVLIVRGGKFLGGEDWRLSILKVLSIFGVLVWASSELLSLFKELTAEGLVVFWFACVLTSGIVFMIIASRQKLTKPSFSSPHFFRVSKIKVIPDELIPLVYTILATIILLVIGYVAAPNNWDSMTYHLSRVVHWQQQKSIQFYSTAILRQLYSGPWAEWVILQFQLLGNTDRFANLIQWAAMIGSLIGVSYIVKLLKGSRKAQIFSLIIVISIPMGILQSTSTQNDYVVSFWLVSFIAFTLSILENNPKQLQQFDRFFFAGASLGLGFLTKATMAVFAVPFVVWLVITLWRRSGWRFWKPLFIIGMTAMVVNSGQFIRNYLLFGSPLGPFSEFPGSTDFKNTNDIYNLDVTISNILRNSALHLATPSDKMNSLVLELVSSIHNWLGLGISDPRTTWTGAQFGVAFSMQEDAAGNPIHFILLGLSFLLLFRHRDSRTILFGVCGMIGFVLFSFLLNWQPWNSRLQLPLFVVGSAFLAVVLTKTLPRSMNVLFACILMVAAVPYLLNNPTRSLIGQESVLIKDRISQYFTNQENLEDPYKLTTTAIQSSGCTQVGLIMNPDDWEYPLWVLTGATKGMATLEHIEVENDSARYATNFSPCAVIVIGREPEKELVYQDIVYSIAFYQKPITLYFAPGYSYLSQPPNT